MNKNIMVDWQPPLLVIKLWLVLLPVIITVTNPEVTATYDEHAKRKLEADASGFINIDCGASERYTDNETGLVYESDKNYIETGENHKISPNFNSWGSHKQPRHTLRSFPQGQRNCYALKPKQGRNNNYLIRAIFEYGNYDGKNEAPGFQLYLGVNKWMYVSGDDDIAIREITHVPSTEYIHVCLVNTGDGVPHISVLELRPVDKSIYAIPNGALITRQTVDVGGQNDYTRYPVDVYDRLWEGLSPDDGIYTSTTSNIDTQSFDDSYKVPERVLNTSYTSTNASRPLHFRLESYDSDSQYYVYFHFAEIEKFNDGQMRKMWINLNGQRNLSDFLTLEYLKPLTIASNDAPIDGTDLSFSIYAAEGCDIPPILNAYEVYKLLELQLLPTNLEDVNAIKDIKSRYKVTRNWQGDPCIPIYLSWLGLQCSNDTIPRITSLNLSSSKLAGQIESSFSSFQAIIVL